MNKAIENELQRLRSAIGRTERPDPVDVAVVEVFASSDVQHLLGTILDAGALLGGVQLQDVAVSIGIACLVLETHWPPNCSHTSPPPAVAVLVELSPPRVLKAVKVDSKSGLGTDALIAPEGPTPVILKELGTPSSDEVRTSRSAVLSLLEEWRSHSGLSGNDRLVTPPPVVTQPKDKGRGGAESYPTQVGTECSSLLCFEKTPDTTKVDG